MATNLLSCGTVRSKFTVITTGCAGVKRRPVEIQFVSQRLENQLSVRIPYHQSLSRYKSSHKSNVCRFHGKSGGGKITGGSTYVACVVVFVGSINLSPVQIKPFRPNQPHSDTASLFSLGDPPPFFGGGGFFFVGALTCSRRP
jgi:hypothetical protein